jgi:hypothetical protein
MRLLTELDGQTVPLADCDWVLFAPCGCPVGCCVADIAPTEDQAWREFYDHKRERDRARRDHRMVLMTRERWAAEVMPAMRARCPHQAGQS